MVARKQPIEDWLVGAAVTWQGVAHGRPQSQNRAQAGPAVSVWRLSKASRRVLEADPRNQSSPPVPVVDSRNH